MGGVGELTNVNVNYGELAMLPPMAGIQMTGELRWSESPSQSGATVMQASRMKEAVNRHPQIKKDLIVPAVQVNFWLR